MNEIEPGSAAPLIPEVTDGMSESFARLYGEPLFQLPTDLYIPPDALEIFLEAFEGPLDLLLYLIRKQNFNVLDIPMAEVTAVFRLYRTNSSSQLRTCCGISLDGSHVD